MFLLFEINKELNKKGVHENSEFVGIVKIE